jgi:hypothetical protein
LLIRCSFGRRRKEAEKVRIDQGGPLLRLGASSRLLLELRRSSPSLHDFRRSFLLYYVGLKRCGETEKDKDNENRMLETKHHQSPEKWFRQADVRT